MGKGGIWLGHKGHSHRRKGFWLTIKPVPVCSCYPYAHMHTHLAVFLATLCIKKVFVIALELVPIKMAEFGTPAWHSGKSM